MNGGLMLSLLLLLAAPQIDKSAIQISAMPQPVWIEEGAMGSSLNFDVILHNSTAGPVEINQIQVSVFDHAGTLVLRKLIDGNGTRPSIRTLDLASIPAGATVMVFNPFDRFDKGIDLTRLVYDVKLSGGNGSHHYEATLVVEPQPYVTRTHLILPLKGRVIVYDGHDFYAHHRRWDYTIPGLQQLGFTTNFMRYSYDFVPVDAEGVMARGDEARNENWFGFGRDLRAAGAGTVVALVDTRPDDRTFDPSQMGGDTMTLWGNYLVIDHGNGEFSLYGHIRQGSSRVKVGDKIGQGTILAAIGAAGSSKFPHLHYELQTGIRTSSEGLPSIFHNFERILGSKRLLVKSGTPDSGDIIEGR
jgi:hypothetical protein